MKPIKLTYTFDPNNQEDSVTHMRLLKSTDMAVVLFELQSNFWREFENGDSVSVADIKEKLANLYFDNGIIIDELIM